MKTYTVDVVEYILPNGRKENRKTELPIETQPSYLDMLKYGCRFESEILRTGQISVTINNGEEDVDISITENSPEVQQGMVDMLKREQWNLNDNVSIDNW